MTQAYGVTYADADPTQDGQMQPAGIVTKSMDVSPHIVSHRKLLERRFHASADSAWFTLGSASMEAVRIRRNDLVYSVDTEFMASEDGAMAHTGARQLPVVASLAGMAVCLDDDTVTDASATWYRMRHGSVLMRMTKDAAGNTTTTDVSLGAETNEILNEAIQRWCNKHVRLEGVALTDIIPGHLGQNTFTLSVADSGAISIINTLPYIHDQELVSENALLGIEWPRWGGPGTSGSGDTGGGGESRGYIDADMPPEHTLFGRPTLRRVDAAGVSFAGQGYDGGMTFSLKDIFEGGPGAEDELVALWEYMDIYFGGFVIAEITNFESDGTSVVRKSPVYELRIPLRANNIPPPGRSTPRVVIAHGRKVIDLVVPYAQRAGLTNLAVTEDIIAATAIYLATTDSTVTLRSFWSDHVHEARQLGTPWGTSTAWIRNAYKVLMKQKLPTAFSLTGPASYVRLIEFARRGAELPLVRVEAAFYQLDSNTSEDTKKIAELNTLHGLVASGEVLLMERTQADATVSSRKKIYSAYDFKTLTTINNPANTSQTVAAMSTAWTTANPGASTVSVITPEEIRKITTMAGGGSAVIDNDINFRVLIPAPPQHMMHVMVM